MTIHDHTMRDFVRWFLGADDHTLSPEDAQSALVQMTESVSVSNVHVLFAAQVFFRYMLLDVCADAYNLPRTEANRIILRSPQAPSGGVEKMHKAS